VNGCEIDFLELCFEIQLFLCLNLDLRSVARFPTAALKTRSCVSWTERAKDPKNGAGQKMPAGAAESLMVKPMGPTMAWFVDETMGFNGKFNAGYKWIIVHYCMVIHWYFLASNFGQSMSKHPIVWLKSGFLFMKLPNYIR